MNEEVNYSDLYNGLDTHPLVSGRYKSEISDEGGAECLTLYHYHLF